MTPEESARLIDAAGGSSALAELIGLGSEDGARQRVNNWRRRGIPADVILEHQKLFERLQRQPANAAA
jgi:hypothetical protein